MSEQHCFSSPAAAPCNLVDHQSFRGACCLYHKSNFRVSSYYIHFAVKKETVFVSMFLHLDAFTGAVIFFLSLSFSKVYSSTLQT
jgi:hypothetical protein